MNFLCFFVTKENTIDIFSNQYAYLFVYIRLEDIKKGAKQYA